MNFDAMGSTDLPGITEVPTAGVSSEPASALEKVEEPSEQTTDDFLLSSDKLDTLLDDIDTDDES